MASGYEKAACGVDPRNGWGAVDPAASHNGRVIDTVIIAGGWAVAACKVWLLWSWLFR